MSPDAHDLSVIQGFLKPRKKDIVGVVVESAFNWYWLVDGFMEAGYRVHLVNPSAIQKYSGLKHADDKHDAFWLAEMLRLEILPEGYIYPKEERPVRDLLRKRRHLVRLRTSLIVSLQNIIRRNCGVKFRVNEVKRLREDRVSPLLEGNEDLALAGQASKEMLDQLTRQIQKIERATVHRVELKESYRYLLTLPGVGKILALTITLETGVIRRIAQVGDYASCCRKVSSRCTSNEKTKGKGNQKNGNKYLAWAFSRRRSLPGGMMLRPEPTIIAKCARRTSWWRTVFWSFPIRVGPRKIFEIQIDSFQKWAFFGLKWLFLLAKLPV